MERYEALPALPPRAQGTRAGAAVIPNAKMLEEYEDTTMPNDYEPLDHVNPVFRACEEEDGVPDDVKPSLDVKPSSSQESAPTSSNMPAAAASQEYDSPEDIKQASQEDGPPEVAPPDSQDDAAQPASPEDSEEEASMEKVDLSKL